MQELIFIIILAVFIGGMLKCDKERDRSNNFDMFAESFTRQLAKDFGVDYDVLAGFDERIKPLPEKTIILTTPTSSDTRFYDQFVARCNRTESEEK